VNNVNGSAWAPLPWQQDRWAQVGAAVAAGRLAHALLLAGPRGVGKRHFADGLASYLLCEAAAPAPRPCRQCRSCVQIGAQSHPNLMRLRPAEDKRDIAIDDVRDLLDRLHLSSHYGQAKIAIVEPADALNASGVNALLKTIEEPPARTHLLLIAERWRALPATLRSRCQILRFAPPPEAAALAWLRQQHPGMPEAQARRFARAPLLAAAPDAGEAPAAVEWGRALADVAGGRLQALRVAQGIKREEAQAALELWLRTGVRWLRARLVAGAADRAGPPAGASVAALEQLLADTLEALRGLERNANPTLTVESIMIRWASSTST
jgi:DNA polymerase-3 subunit delta'